MVKRCKVVSLCAIFLSACAGPAAGSGQSMPDSWDLVFISASNGWLVADEYARLIEEDQGVTVTVTDLAIGSLSAGEVLDGLEGQGRVADRIRQEAPDLEDPVDLFREADVIVLSLFDPRDSISAEVNDQWNCLEPPPRAYVDTCDMQANAPYFEDIRAIIDRLFELRAGQPTIFRAFDLYGRPAWWQDGDPGLYQACSACWLSLLDAYTAVLAEYDIPVAPVHRVWSEPDYQGDPQDKGYIGFDGIHPSRAGAQSMAQLLHELGYSVTEPPTP